MTFMKNSTFCHLWTRMTSRCRQEPRVRTVLEGGITVTNSETGVSEVTVLPQSVILGCQARTFCAKSRKLRKWSFRVSSRARNNPEDGIGLLLPESTTSVNKSQFYPIPSNLYPIPSSSRLSAPGKNPRGRETTLGNPDQNTSSPALRMARSLTGGYSWSVTSAAMMDGGT